jgi:hypothetical protein
MAKLHALKLWTFAKYEQKKLSTFAEYGEWNNSLQMFSLPKGPKTKNYLRFLYLIEFETKIENILEGSPYGFVRKTNKDQKLHLYSLEISRVSSFSKSFWQCWCTVYAMIGMI